MKYQAFSNTSVRESPYHILSALLDYKALKGRDISNSLFKSCIVVPTQSCVLHWQTFTTVAFCMSQYTTNLEITNLLDWIWILCVTLVEKVVSCYLALFAHLYNGNHTIYLTNKAIVRKYKSQHVQNKREAICAASLFPKEQLKLTPYSMPRAEYSTHTLSSTYYIILLLLVYTSAFLTQEQ